MLPPNILFCVRKHLTILFARAHHAYQEKAADRKDDGQHVEGVGTAIIPHVRFLQERHAEKPNGDDAGKYSGLKHPSGRVQNRVYPEGRDFNLLNP